MRGSTIAAVATCTLLAITGCANSEQTPPTATAAGAANVAGLDKGTAEACATADQATRGENGRDLDLATAKEIVTLGNTSKSTIITAATGVLSSTLQRAQAAAGDPDEAVLTAEVSTAILKFRTACQDTDAVKASITKATKDSGGRTGSADDPAATTNTKAN